MQANAIGWRGSIAYKELQENYYPALGFVNRVNVSDLQSELGYTWYPQSDAIRQVHSGVDFQRIETLQGDLESQIITLRPLEIGNHSADQVNFLYHIIDEVLVEPFEVSDGVIIPVGEYSFNQYCIELATGEFRHLAGSGYYCGVAELGLKVTNIDATHERKNARGRAVVSAVRHGGN